MNTTCPLDELFLIIQPNVHNMLWRYSFRTLLQSLSAHYGSCSSMCACEKIYFRFYSLLT